jgi:hypothetical protein
VSIINRRNAILGWAVWQGSKRFAKLQAKGVTPSVQGSRRNKPLLAFSIAGVSVAGIVGALTFWRRHQSAAES